MRNFILMILFSFFCSIGMIYAENEVPKTGTDYEAAFATFASVAALTGVITEVIKKLFKEDIPNWAKILISWVTGIILGFFAWGFDLGMFAGLEWWQTLLWGLGAGLASNGIWDSGLIEWLFRLFTSKKKTTL